MPNKSGKDTVSRTDILDAALARDLRKGCHPIFYEMGLWIPGDERARKIWRARADPKSTLKYLAALAIVLLLVRDAVHITQRPEYGDADAVRLAYADEIGIYQNTVLILFGAATLATFIIFLDRARIHTRAKNPVYRPRLYFLQRVWPHPVRYMLLTAPGIAAATLSALYVLSIAACEIGYQLTGPLALDSICAMVVAFHH